MRLPGKVLTRPHTLNAGVLFLRPSAWAAALLRAWEHARTGICLQAPKPPLAEQGCLERMLFDPHYNRTAPPPHADRRVVLAPFTLFNSPVGEFIKHLWSGPGHILRSRLPDGFALQSVGLPTPSRVDEMVRRVRDEAVKSIEC